MTGYLRLLTLFAPALSFGITQAQLLPDTVSTGNAEINAIQFYHNTMGSESRIYNGRDHISYLPMTGHPYFQVDTPQTGSIIYEGLLYQHFPLLYDIVRDEVIVVNPDGDRLVLSNERVKEFTLMGHHFIQTSSGYYDVLCTGTVTLMAQRSKKVVETIENMQIDRYIADHVNFYAVKGGKQYSIGSLHALLALMKDKKKEINQDLRRKKIRYRKQPEQALLEASNYYNQSSPL